jgi:Beta-propeller repeat
VAISKLAMCPPAGGHPVPEGNRGPDSGTSEAKGRIREAYGRLPLSFEPNRGQIDPRVRFLARGGGYSLFLTATDAVLSLWRSAAAPDDRMPSSSGSSVGPIRDTASTRAVVTMRVVDANPEPEAAGQRVTTGASNYFIGNDPTQWVTDIPIYERVNYRDIYPGVDLVYYGTQSQLEYDFVVSAGADPSTIRLDFEGASNLTVTPAGDLLMQTPTGEICQHQPLVYQDTAAGRREVGGHYVCAGGRWVSFQVGSYDPTRPLVIDPVLAYSTYLGGIGSDSGFGIAVDTEGNAHVTGETFAPNFPTIPGAFQQSDPDPAPGHSDVFVSKLNPAGSALIYSTYLGGHGHDSGFGIAVDGDGNAYITGRTESRDFPTTGGAFQRFNPDARPGIGHPFATKLNPAGSALFYSTFLGGKAQSIPQSDQGAAIAVDGDGNAYVTGRTESPTFPTTPGAFQHTDPDPAPGHSDAFVTKLNPTGSALVYSTYLGGSGDDQGRGVAVDWKGHAYITGLTDSRHFPTTPDAFQPTDPDPGNSHAFVTKLNPAGSALVYSTYLGGTGLDEGEAIAVDGDGNAYVTGATWSDNFPTTPGAFQPTDPDPGSGDAFVTKLDPAGSSLIYSTYLGGSGQDDEGSGLAVDRDGNAYITGTTLSDTFPTTPDAFQSTDPDPGNSDAFVTKLNPAGSALVYSTYLGGTGYDLGRGIAVDENGSVYVTGLTNASNFPTLPGAFQPTDPDPGDQDAFVTGFRQ